MNNIIKSIVLAFAITTFACGKMIGQETLTVYDGSTTNNHIPMYVYYFDDFTRSQYVIPASELGEMDGGRITSMKFYPNSSTAYTTVSEVDIYLKEVGYTSISAFENKSSATIVYHGTVVFGGGSATITFTTPFTYNGGNLLIGCDNTTDAGYSSIYFYGQSVTGASVSGSNASSLANVTATQQNFIPKTTFSYTPALDAGCNIVGHGTSKDYWMPTNTLYNYSITQQIYTSSEIGSSGIINSVSFKYAYSEPFSMSGIKVYMKNTTKSSFAGTSASDFEPLTDGDKVFEGTFSATRAGWVTINLDNPFNYTGNNLIVCFYDQTTGRPGSGEHKFYYTATDDYTSITFYNESNSGSYNIDINNLASYSGSNRNRFQYHANAKFCLSPCTVLSTPTNLSVTASGGSANLSWNSVSNASSYKVCWGTTSDCTDGCQDNITGTSYTVSGLSAGTCYFRVMANGNGTTYCSSNFTTPVSATIDDHSLALSAGSVACSGSGTTLTATATGYTSPRYTWSASPSTGAGLPSSHTNLTSNTITVTPTVGGNYTYTCSVTEGTSGSATTSSITISVPQTPTVSISPATVTACGSYEITPTISTNCGNATYAWSRNGTALGGTTENYTATTSGTYIITVTNNSYKQYDKIVQNGIAAIVVVAPTATTDGKAVPLTDGIGSNESAGNIPYNAATNLQRAIVVNGGVRYDSGNREGFKIPSGGCPATASVNVTIDVAPTLSLYSGSTSQDICVDNSIGGIVYHYTPTSANASVSGLPSGVTYTASSGVLSIHGTPTASGNFGYTVTVPAGSCPPATLEGTINVADKLMVAVNSPQVCKGSSVTLQASGAATYSWSPTTYLSGTGNSVSFSSASSSVVAGNSYTVTVTGTSGNCRNSAVATVSVVGKVTPTFTNPGPYCEGATPASLPSCTAVDPVSGSVITGSWNPNTISTSSSGTNTYTFNVTSGQCANNGSVSVVVNALPTVGITPSATTICTGSQEVLTATAGYSNYAWSNGSATAGTATGNTYRIIPITAGGTYSVTVTDGNGCRNNTTVAITVKYKVTPTFDAASYCIGDNANYPTCTTADPITNTLISGSWPTTPISTASAGTTDYTFTVNSGQCANDGTLSVTVVNCCDISVSDITYTDPTCYGGNNGTATVTVDGGTAPFTYLWSDGETTTSNVRDDLPAGAYSVTVRDANGCESGRETTNECFRITDIMYHSCNANHLEGFNEMFTMLIGPNDLDADNMGITWATGSLNFTGFCENQAAVDGINAIITGGGHIIVPVNGILPANSEVLVVTSQLFDYESFGFAGLDHDVYILFQCNESVTTGHFGNTPDGSTRTFSVSFTSPSCSDEVSYYTTTNSPGDAVHYNADGTVDYYNNGCQAPVFYNEIVLSDPEEITLSYSSISGYQNVDLGGISPVTNCTGTATYTSTDLPDGLALDYSTGVITGTPEHQEDGSFSVTMTCDGCEAHYTVDYHFDEEPDYQGCIIDEDFSEITTGGNTATSGTNGPLGTELTPNFISDFPTTSRAYAAGGVVKLGSGSYSGFIQTVPLNLSVPFYVEFDVKGWTTVEGDIIVTVSGGETQTVSYTATIGGDFEHKRINFNAATSTSTVTIATFAKRAFIDNVKVCYPDPCSVEARQIAGVCEGKIIIEAEGSGGLGDFSYAWDNGAGNAAQYNGAVSGTTYTVVATDEVGCTAEASVTPVQTGNPEITPSFDAIICNEGTTDIVLTVTGGVGEPYTYHWEESTSTTNTIENVIAGTYHVTVSDANCSAESTISVTEPDAVTFDVTTTPQVCNTPGTATVSNEQGGNGTYSYEWSNSSTVASVELTSGNYSVTVRDGNDCSASAAVTVGSSSTSVSFSATPSNPTCSYQTGSIVVNNFVGASPYTVAWDGGSVDNITGSYTITNLGTGNYTVTVTDADGCGDTHTGISITVPSEITFTVSSSPQICTTSGSATVEIANSGNYSYVWHNSANEVVGSNSNVLSDVNAGTYSVTVTSTATGCSATGTGTVGNNPTNVTFSADATSPTCSYETGSIAVTDIVGTANYTVAWNGGSDDGVSDGHYTISNLGTGNYTVTVTDANGCSATQSGLSITVPSAITFTVSSTPQICTTPGSATVEIANSGNYSYVWHNSANEVVGSNSNVLSDVNAGTYSVTVTSTVTGCSATGTGTVGSSSTSVSFSAEAASPNCSYEIGSIAVTDIVGTANYTVAWDGGSEADVSADHYTISNLGTGNYSVTVTDANGCSATQTVLSITVPSEITFTVSSTPQICATPGSATVEIANSGNYSYVWRNSANEVVGSNSNVLSDVNAGTYNVTVTSTATGCSATGTGIVGSSSTSVSFDATPSSPTCSYQTGSIVVNNFAGASPYTVAWDGGSVDDITGSYTITNLGTGIYTVIVTDADGCGYTQADLSITVPSAIAFTVSSTPQICTTLGSATVEIANSGNYSYVWHNSANEVVGSNSNVLSDVNAGTYSVTVTSTATGCSATGTGTVGNNPTNVTFSAEATSPNCSYETGSIAVTGIVGTANYTVAWNGGSDDGVSDDHYTISNLGTGNYTVTVTDANGCSATQSGLSITVPSEITFSISSTPQICTTPGSATVEIANSGNYSYVWHNSTNEVVGSNSNVLSDVNAGTYSVTVTSTATGCSATGTGTVGNNPTNITFSAEATSPTCSYETGSIAVADIVGTANYTVAWDGGSESDVSADHYTISNLGTGNYTITITDANGCSATQSGLSITVPSEIAFTVSTTPQICTTPGSATVEITNSGNYTYIWRNSTNEVVGTNSNVLSDVNAGTYSVTVTSTATGCSAIGTGIVGSSSTSVSFSTTATSPTCSYQTGSIAVTNIQGLSPYTIEWDGGSADNVSADHYSIEGLGTGNYTVIVTDADGCGSSQAGLTITIPSAINFTLTSTDQVCTTPGTLTVEIANSDDCTYVWHNSSDETVGDGTSVLTATAGTYSIIVTAPNGCTAESSATIGSSSTSVSFSVTATSPNCSYETGSIVITNIAGTAPYTIDWDGGSADNITEDHYTIAGLGTGDYTVIVTDVDGCGSSQDGLSVIVPDAITFDVLTTDQVCNTPGTATVSNEHGGTAPYTYEWSNLSTGASVEVTAGNYSVTVTDGDGCFVSAAVSVGSSSTTVSFDATATSPNCSYETGSIAVTNIQGTAPYTVAWDGGSADNIDEDHYTITGLTTGDYTVIVTDADGCGSSQAGLTITIPSAINFTLTSTDQVCTTSGTLTVEIANSDDYTYVWHNSSNETVGDDTSVLTANAGNYSVIVTAPNGCTAESSATIGSSSTSVSFNATTTSPNCSYETGSIAVTNVQGSAPYTIAWDGGSADNIAEDHYTIVGLATGDYTVIVTDADGCGSSQAGLTIEIPMEITYSVSTVEQICSASGSITLESVSGGAGGYSYQWSNSTNEAVGNGTNVLSGVNAGVYNVTVTDADGCEKTDVITLNGTGGVVSFSLIAHKLRCNGDGSGTIDVENITGRSPYSVVWTSTMANGTENNVMTSQYEISGLPAGNYTIIVTDADECSSTLTTTVEEPALLEASASLVSPVMCFGDKFDITVSAEGGSLADGNEYSYHWINDVDVQSQTALEDFGLYSVTVTDDNGCIATSSVNVEEPSQVQITISASDILCNGQTSTVTVTGNGGTGVYSGTGTFENVNAGSHTYTIADENGCSASDDITITEPDELGVNFNNIVAQTCETLGSVELSISNAQGNTTYSWDGGSANAYTSTTTEHLGTGSHTISVIDGNGCTATENVSIPNGSGMTLSPNPSQPARCFGENSGSVMINFVNGTTPYTILWNGNLINETNDYHYFDNLTAGTYDVTVTDANGCSGNTSVEIGQPDDFVATASVTSAINCHDDAFDISASAQGGNGGYTYMWNGSVAGQSQSGLTEYSTYNVVVTDAEGCTATASVTPENPQELTITSIVADAILCHGGTTVVSAYAGGGSGTLNYTWATEGVPSVNSQQITAPAGTYSLTVTDGNGCWISTTYVVDTPDEISIEITRTTEQYCTTLGEVQLAVGGGTGNLSYTWDGNTINPIVGSSIVSQLSAGTHTLTVTDGNGCTATLPVTIDYGAEMSVAASQPDSVRCFGETNGEFTISMNDGFAPYTIAWNNGTITEYSDLHTFANLSAGTYGITVTDAHNCMEMISVEVGAPERLMALSSAERILCHGESAEVTVSATGGTLPYQNTGIYNLVAGEYDYMVTDANGCTSSTHVSLSEPTSISVNAVAVNALCFGGNGSATLMISGGTNPYSVVWQDNSTGLDNTHIPVNTNFGYTVTDLNGCTYDGTVTVGQPQQLSLDLSVTPVSCFGLEDARVGVSHIGGGTLPYNYLWSNGNTVNTLVGVGAGTYSLLVTDANGCTISSTAVVTQPEALNVSVVSSNVECGISNGSLSANVYGGSQPYVYYWSNGGTSALLDNVSAGAYSLTVTDANGCSATSSSQINVAGMLSASIVEQSPVSCFGMTDATLVAVVEQAQPPVMYQWNNGQNGSTLFGLGTGMYIVTVTDGWGCQGVANYMLYSPTAMIMSSQVTDAKCSNTSEGAISLTVGGGRPPYSYLWTTGSTEPNLEDLRVGSYGVLVTDMSGCTMQENFVISAPTTISVEADVTDVTCYGKKDGRVEINVTGGVEPYAYGFYMGNTVSHNGRVYEHLRPGVYNISVSDANGCGKSISVAVGQPERLGVNSMVSAPSCKDLHDATVEIVTAGGTAPFTYTLGTYTSDSSIFINLHPGLYSAVVTDANGCSNEISEIIVPESKLDCLRIPNVITPNGDGVNDEWIIENIELFPEAHIYVYNRWGQLLYHDRGNGERWDGSYRGHFVPSGVYMYIIKLESVEETYEGTVTVLY